ncbi:MAG: serine/threonine protein kinase [Verrucomicrobiales bacterium]|nr:serine/threonine protein kinase [Verrucomicrobiales bacterium]
MAESTDSARPPGRRPPPPLDAVRSAFPALEVLELIGSGGMGFVYAARQPHLDRRVALKLLPVAPDSDPAFAERFAREGRLLARLNHPHIVAVYEYGQVPGFCYLILEFVDGVNLRQAMESGRFSPAEALAIVPRICEALQYAHEQGVLHRDIKPENLLLDSRGRVKIADFGIAKMVGDRVTDITLTASGARLGTPHYMAPEQIESPSAVDHRADIYSLGVVFYELLTGELPLGRFGPPSSKASLDARIDEIVMRALAKERELRQQSAGEVKTQVEGLEGGSPVQGAFSWAQDHSTFGGRGAFEYKSRRTIGGLPWIHIVSGIDPKTGRAREARGVLALGPRARGVFAVGGSARGVVAFGGGAMGVVAFGGFAFGGVAIGGFAVGLFSFGGFALALLLALGGFAVGSEAFGGLAVGFRALGGLVYSGVPMTSLGWERTVLNWLPWIWAPLLLVTLVVMVGSIALTLWAARRQGQLRETGRPPEVRPNPWPHRLYWLIVGSFMIVGSAVISGVGLPILMRSIAVEWGQMHPGWFRPMTILLGWLPALVGGFVVLRYRQTRPTSSRATPVSEWNPWPKRIFMGILILVVIPFLLLMIGLLVPRMMARPRPMPDPLPVPGSAALHFEPHLLVSLPAGQETRIAVKVWRNGVPRTLQGAGFTLKPGIVGDRPMDLSFALTAGDLPGTWSISTPVGTSAELAIPEDLDLAEVVSGPVRLRAGERTRRWLFVPVECDLTQIHVSGEKWSYRTLGGGEERPINGISVDIEPQDAGDLDDAILMAAQRLDELMRAQDRTHLGPGEPGSAEATSEDLDRQVLEARKQLEALQRAASGSESTLP